MKLTLAIAAALIGSANAFSAVAPNGNAAAAVDHSLKGIDDGAAHDVFDPTAGDNGESYDLGVKTFVLFPKVPDELKTNLGVEAYNPDGIVHRAIRMIKEKYPDSVVCTDVALDPYSDQGHDGVVEDGKILNDVTINQLCKQAVSQARAGADVVAPSDMMVS